ncbi:hypothetical protein CLU79DRAFT_690824, partial [Phycomyces nitens]
VLIRGSRHCRTTIGRGHDATVRIGRKNKLVSREHVVIEHKPTLGFFELTILSPNAALIDQIVFTVGEHVPVTEGSIIEIMGTRLTFLEPSREAIGDEPMATRELEDHHQSKLESSQSLQSPISSPKPSPKTTLILLPETPQQTPQQTPVLPTMTPTSQTSTPIPTPPVLQTPTALVIQVLGSSRKSSMTVREIAGRIKDVSVEEIESIVTGTGFIGCIKRTGKTADGSPKEDLYYYQPEQDPDQDRRKKYSQTGRGARKCTMKDPQYFFRIPPKLPNHRSKTYVPPPAGMDKKRKHAQGDE